MCGFHYNLHECISLFSTSKALYFYNNYMYKLILLHSDSTAMNVLIYSININTEYRRSGVLFKIDFYSWPPNNTLTKCSYIFISLKHPLTFSVITPLKHVSCH